MPKSHLEAEKLKVKSFDIPVYSKEDSKLSEISKSFHEKFTICKD
jgi:hypothetical protein